MDLFSSGPRINVGYVTPACGLFLTWGRKYVQYYMYKNLQLRIFACAIFKCKKIVQKIPY
jgi:hypothetical protein